MRTTSTIVCKLLFALFLSLFSFNTIAQTQNCISPAMTWKSPVLYSGTANQLNAVYKFANVSSGVYALVTITGFVNGATLSNIDDSTFGYSAAWQPVIKTPATILTSSYVKFKIEFKKNINNNQNLFPCFQLSFIDVDGDNVGVKEFVAAKNPDSYDISNITVLSMSNVSGLVKAQGPLVNFTNIDTAAYQTNINYKYRNTDKVDEIWVGNATLASFTVQDRYSCGYFAQISMPWQPPLPVKYLSFDAVVNEKTVLLKWLTTQEITNSHFEVERSFDMTNYNTLGMVLDGFVNGANKSYQYKDNSNELQGRSIVYYRLKQFDIDGKFTYSKVLAVRLQPKADAVMQVSPNPFVDQVNMRFTAAESGIAEIRVLNMAGQTMLSKQSTISKGYNTIQVSDLKGLTTGMYIVQLSMNGAVIDNQRLVKK